MSRSWEWFSRRLLQLIVLTYLVLGTLYALYTPAWQAPDEPAHYNYVQYLADQNRFPVLKPGDYPAAYLEEIKAAHFPPEMSIAPIRYEFHQPPLYYLLAVPLYDLLDGIPLPLRLLSVALGALLLLVVHRIVRELASDRPLLAVGVTAFVAFLPMHLTITAAVSNDILAELLLATVVLLTIRYLKSAVVPLQLREDRLLVLLGVTTGLCFTTKSNAYIALPLVLFGIAARGLWLDDAPSAGRHSLKSTAAYLLLAVGLAAPWWLRNIALYGDGDFLGLARHEQVVAGQLRTAEYIAKNGTAPLILDFVTTSFRSFWGQFGWMGVLLDQRLYQAVAVVSALALIGFLLWAIRTGRAWPGFPKWQRAAGGLLALLALLTLASYLWYNTQFLQHQGRYLFPALVPIGLAVALGWREGLRRELAAPVAILLLLGTAVLRLAGVLSTWAVFLLVVAAAALAVRAYLPRSWDPLVQTIPYLLLILLDLVSLFLFIVPQLQAG